METERSSPKLIDSPVRILITGAGGLFGRAAVNWFSRHAEVIPARHQDLDITDEDAVLQWSRREEPDIIINCAAFSNVDGCELEPERAMQVNAEGPHRLAQAADQIGAALVQLSTDYVFDGVKETPYTIEDEPRPVSVYGQSKLAGENYVRETLGRHYVIRVARLFGPGGENFASDVVRIARRNHRVEAIIDEVGSPTYVVDLAERIGAIMRAGHHGTYHVTNQGACSWYEFTTIALKLAGIRNISIEKVKSEDLHRPALRPHYSALRCLLSARLGFAPMRHWQQAYAEFIRCQAVTS